MTSGCIHLTRSNHVAVARLDSGKPLNPLSFAVMRDIITLARELEDDRETHVVILTGSSGVFSAGLDFGDAETRALINASVDDRRRGAALGARMCRAWENVPQVTISAIEGYCIGGGVSLAVAGDFRIIARNAYLRIPELELGFNMSWQTLPRLANLVGPARAKRMVMLAEKVGAGEALSWGLVDDIADEGGAADLAMEMARKLAAKPPIPLRMTKQAINAHVNALNHTASFMDADQFTLTLHTEDCSEGITAFLEKREPLFKGT
jgi:enoyl-CoA hydratase